MRKNVLALARNADVIECVLHSMKGCTWANQSTQTNWFLLLNSPKSLDMHASICLDWLLKGSSAHGVLAVVGFQLSTKSSNTFKLRLNRDDQSSERNAFRKNRILLEYITFVICLFKRDEEVYHHFPTAKPSATALTVARDLLKIVCTWLRCANAAGCVRLAISAYVLRRFASNCKEGARGY